ATVQFTVAKDVHNEGTMQTAVNAGVRPSLTLICNGTYVSSPSSKIVLRGATVAGAKGGNGGTLTLSTGMVINRGSIDLSGADGDPGGPYDGGAGGSLIL